VASARVQSWQIGHRTAVLKIGNYVDVCWSAQHCYTQVLGGAMCQCVRFACPDFPLIDASWETEMLPISRLGVKQETPETLKICNEM
jgi:hypothetical protein